MVTANYICGTLSVSSIRHTVTESICTVIHWSLSAGQRNGRRVLPATSTHTRASINQYSIDSHKRAPNDSTQKHIRFDEEHKCPFDWCGFQRPHIEDTTELPLARLSYSNWKRKIKQFLSPFIALAIIGGRSRKSPAWPWRCVFLIVYSFPPFSTCYRVRDTISLSFF